MVGVDLALNLLHGQDPAHAAADSAVKANALFTPIMRTGKLLFGKTVHDWRLL